MVNHFLAFLDMDSKRSFEKYLEGEGGNKMLEGFDESDLTLISLVMIK